MKRILIYICLINLLLLSSCTSEKNKNDQSVSETETTAVDSTDREQQTTSSQTEQTVAANTPTSGIRSDVSFGSKSGYSEENSSENTGSTDLPQIPKSPETSQDTKSDVASNSTASKELPSQSYTTPQSPSPTIPKWYLAEDYKMTYNQMEDICRAYVESHGLQYDPTFTIENAGFTGRISSFGDTWEEFYGRICGWIDITVELDSPKYMRVQFIRNEDGTSECAYVLWI